MAEGQDPTERDPREFRGGAHEPEEVKGGPDSWADTEGVVPREMLDEPAPESDDPQAQGDAALGEFADRPATDDNFDSNEGDEADAAKQQTGAAATETKEEMDKDQPVSWVQGANVAREQEEG